MASLKQLLLEEISEHYCFDEKFEVVYVHETLKSFIKLQGEEPPTYLDLAEFNGEEGLPTIEIHFDNQDKLFYYEQSL